MSALRRIRVDKRLSITELAAQSGVSPEQIRNLETGRARNPRVDTLAKLAGVLEVEPSQLDPMLTAEPDRSAA